MITPEEHAARVDRLQQTSREEVFERQVMELVRSVRSGELTEQDVIHFTTIPIDYFRELMGRVDDGQ